MPGMQRPLPLPRFLGVVHLLPLPGSPRFAGDLEGVLTAACRDAEALLEGGVGGLIVENFGDAPFRPGVVDPETVAAMAVAMTRVRTVVGSDLPMGANVLRNDARAALGLCAAAGASFLRINVHTGAAVCDQGPIVGRADETLRTRRELFGTGELPPILADVHVKHASPMGRESIGVAAADTLLRGLADGLVVSGTGTGAGVDLADLREVRGALPDAPIWIGSGWTPERSSELLALADGAIVGTWLKADGRLAAPVDAERVRRAADCFA